MDRAESDHAAYVVGVDFGTLSGRAVVVRVSDGKELADAVIEYPHAVLENSMPDGTALPPDWALQVPDDYREVLRTAVPKALAEADVGAGRRRGHRHRLHRVHDGADARRRHTAQRGARSREPSACLHQVVEAPCRPAAGRPDQPGRRGAGRVVAASIRRPDQLGVGVREGSGALRGRPRGLRPDGPVRRGGRLDRVAAVWQLRPQRLRGGLQGPSPGGQVSLVGLPR